MSNKSIEMKRLNGQGGYDSLYPKTLSSNTIVSDVIANDVNLPSGATLDEVLIKKENDLPIGTILASAVDLGENYLPIDNMDLQVKVNDYPELYDALRLEQLTSGWQYICAAPKTGCKKIGYNNGLYWITDNSNLYYKQSLNDESWVQVGQPSTNYNCNFIDCINNVWFWCGNYTQSDSTRYIYIYYAKSAQDIINNNWYRLSRLTNTDKNSGSYVYKDIQYMNNCYIFRATYDSQYHQFSCYTELKADQTPIMVRIESNVGSSYPNAVYPQCIGVNGYWYCYHYLHDSNKYMGLYAASSFSGLQSVTSNTAALETSWSENTTVERILNNIGALVFMEYKNNKYYIYTLNGIYTSTNPLSDFTKTSDIPIANSKFVKSGNYYWTSASIRNNSSTNNKNNQYREGVFIDYSITPISFKSGVIYRSFDSSSAQYLEGFSYIEEISCGFAIDGSSIYINTGEFFNLPYIMSGSPIKYYIKAKNN